MNLLQVMMLFNNLGVSANRRCIQAGIVKVNGCIVFNMQREMWHGNIVTIGKHTRFKVVSDDKDKLSIVDETPTAFKK